VANENALGWVRRWTLLTNGEKLIRIDVPQQAVACSGDVTLCQLASAVAGALEECPVGDLSPVPMVPRRLVELTS
jgi:hypothetical protein